MSDLDSRLIDLYRAGATRQSAMKTLGFSTNTISSHSHRLGLYWAWPLANRLSGVAPPPAPQQPKPEPAPKPSTITTDRRKNNGGGTMASIRARQAYLDRAVPQNPSTSREIEPSRISPKASGFVTSCQKRQRGYIDSDFYIGGSHSPFPAPTAEVPLELIHFIATKMYR